MTSRILDHKESAIRLQFVCQTFDNRFSRLNTSRFVLVIYLSEMMQRSNACVTPHVLRASLKEKIIFAPNSIKVADETILETLHTQCLVKIADEFKRRYKRQKLDENTFVVARERC